MRILVVLISDHTHHVIEIKGGNCCDERHKDISDPGMFEIESYPRYEQEPEDYIYPHQLLEMTRAVPYPEPHHGQCDDCPYDVGDPYVYPFLS